MATRRWSAALAELKTRGVTVVIVTHRRSLTSRLDRIAILRNGKIESFGHTATVLVAAWRDSRRYWHFPRPKHCR